MHGDFLLDPDLAYLNHGSFGACPRAVFEEYQARRRRASTPANSHVLVIAPYSCAVVRISSPRASRSEPMTAFKAEVAFGANTRSSVRARGHVPLELEALGADVYAGSCHYRRVCAAAPGRRWSCR